MVVALPSLQIRGPELKMVIPGAKGGASRLIAPFIGNFKQFSGVGTAKDQREDLYRIAKTQPSIDSTVLVNLASDRQIKLSLNRKWISPPMEGAWKDYTQKKVYKGASDLPSDLGQAFEFINKYIYNVTNVAK